MSKAAVAFLTKDRVELSRQTIEPLRFIDGCDIFWIDGSRSDEGVALATSGIIPPGYVHTDVRGGAGAAIVFALTTLLNAQQNYDYIGLLENDVLLPADWFLRSLDLFERGRQIGLDVGAVSARCFVDRVLFQQAGFAVCHNLGAGCILFSREAALLALDRFRSGWSTDNRRVFSQLSGIDIGPFWAFRGSDHPLVADWHWDAMLAAHGLASLALTPSDVEMVGQVPSLADQGLEIVKALVAERIDNGGFNIYRARLRAVRDQILRVNTATHFQYQPLEQAWWYSPHQWHKLGASFTGGWRFRENRAFGEFAWVAEAGAVVHLPLFGVASLLVTGGKAGGQIEISDPSGYECAPFLAPEGDAVQAMLVPLPGVMAQRLIRITADPGVTLVRLACREAQATLPAMTFHHGILPPPV